MFCFYKEVVACYLIHSILNQPFVQLLQNMNCWKTDLKFAFFISEYNPVVTIQAVMHEITADPAVFSNCTLGWNRWHNMNCQQIYLQVLTSQIKRWSGTPGTVIPKKIDIYETENGSRVYIIPKKINYICVIEQVWGQDGWILAKFCFVFLYVYGPRQSGDPYTRKKKYPPIFTEQTWSIGNLLYGFWGCHLPARRSVWWKTVTESLKMLSVAAGQGSHFQDRSHSFSPYGPQ